MPVNCIFWDGGDEIYNDDGSVVVVTFSNVQDGGGRFPFPGEGIVNMGAYGGTARARKSLSGSP